MTPMQCASLMMRNNADPGLIAAYLALELKHDPTLAMTPMQRLGHQLGVALKGMGASFSCIAKLFAQPPTKSDYTLAGPAKEGK